MIHRVRLLPFLLAGVVACAPRPAGSGPAAPLAADTVATIDTRGLLDGPDGLALDDRGDLYVANWAGGKGSTIVRVPRDGEPHVFARGLRAPDGLAFGPDGLLYVANFGDGTVSRVAADGSHTVFASGLGHPAGIVFDADGRLYVADFGDYDGSVVWRVEREGRTAVFARGFAVPLGLAVDQAGGLWVSNFGSGAVHRVGPDGVPRVVATVPNAPRAMLQFIALDDDGSLLVPSYGHHRVYRIRADGRVEVAAGTGEKGDDDGPPLAARFRGPNAIVRAPDGALWVTEYDASRLRRLRLGAPGVP